MHEWHKTVCKKCKRIEPLIQMCHANNEKLKETNNEWDRKTKSIRIRTLREKENYKYLGILEADTFKQVEMEEKMKKKYLRRRRKLQQKFHQRDKHLGCHSCKIPGTIFKWTREELRQMNQTTTKLMTNHWFFHPRQAVFVKKRRGKNSPALK